MAKKSEEVIGVAIPEIEIQELTMKIVGDSPLIVHAWSEKAKKMMLDAQMKKASKGREVRDPFAEFCDSLYWLSDRPENPTMEDIQKATFGFPTVAFKSAAIDAGYQQGVIPKKTTARGAFHLTGDFAIIDGEVNMREDMVRLSGPGRAADFRYRGEFKDWSTLLHVRYNKNAISAEQIVNLMNVGGFACGVGEWRPGKNGSFGMFHVE